MRGHLLLMLLCCAVASALASTKHHPIKYSTKRYATGKNSSSSKKLSYGSHRLITYIVDWDVPSTINWGKLDHVTYAFAEPNAEGKLESITSTNLKSVVSKAHKNNVGVSLSVGGWSGSKYFSSLVKSSAKRSVFIKNIVSLVESYSLDGINLDWEYPNDPDGSGCNELDSNDTANYLMFIKALREQLDKKYPSSRKLITVAVGTSVFMDENQKPIKKLDSNWKKYVDYFYIMAYDISGSWDKKTGPNAPLEASPNYDSSVVQAVSAWYESGIPKKQIIVGVPFYGTALKTNKPITSTSGPYVPLAGKSNVKGDKYDEKSVDSCSESKVTTYSGSYEWRSIVSEGINSGKGGWKVYWDKTAHTPYAYQSSSRKYLTYDNARSLKEKVEYVNDQQLGGVMVWSLEMDDSSNTLLNSLQSVRKVA